jgi:translation initiation factor IF-3
MILCHSTVTTAVTARCYSLGRKSSLLWSGKCVVTKSESAPPVRKWWIISQALGRCCPPRNLELLQVRARPLLEKGRDHYHLSRHGRREKSTISLPEKLLRRRPRQSCGALNNTNITVYAATTSMSRLDLSDAAVNDAACNMPRRTIVTATAPKRQQNGMNAAHGKSRNSRPNNSENGPLCNERLVQRLMTLKRATHAAQIQVRLVPDPLQHRQRPSPTLPTDTEPNGASLSTAALAVDPPEVVQTDKTAPSTSKILSLEAAIQQALSQDKDLMEISLHQEIPVVTIAKVAAILYHGKKKKSSPAAASTARTNNNASTSNTAASQQIKQVTMMVGIADNDLQRKVADIVRFTEKGHACTVTVRAARKHTRDNVSATRHGVDRVWSLLQESTELIKGPELNETQTMGQFQVKKKSSAKKK